MWNMQKNPVREYWNLDNSAKAYALRDNRQWPFNVNKQIKNIINHSLLKTNFLKEHQKKNYPFPGTIHHDRREET